MDLKKESVESASFSSVDMIMMGFEGLRDAIVNQQDEIQLLKQKDVDNAKKDILTIKDIIKEFSISKSKIEVSKRSGELKYFKSGVKTYYKRSEFELWFYRDYKVK